MDTDRYTYRAVAVPWGTGRGGADNSNQFSTRTLGLALALKVLLVEPGNHHI